MRLSILWQTGRCQIKCMSLQLFITMWSFKILQTMVMVSLKHTVKLTHMVAVVDTFINIINHLMFM